MSSLCCLGRGQQNMATGLGPGGLLGLIGGLASHTSLSTRRTPLFLPFSDLLLSAPPPHPINFTLTPPAA